MPTPFGSKLRQCRVMSCCALPRPFASWPCLRNSLLFLAYASRLAIRCLCLAWSRSSMPVRIAAYASLRRIRANLCQGRAFRVSARASLLDLAVVLPRCSSPSLMQCDTLYRQSQPPPCSAFAWLGFAAAVPRISEHCLSVEKLLFACRCAKRSTAYASRIFALAA